MKGLIFSIKRYSIHDGPGVRVTIFMKGCPLSCKWCHNPEGIFPEPETISTAYRIGDREFFRNEVAGKYYTVDDVIKVLGRERVFMNHSKGGVTFSGGEPMLQIGFLLEVLEVCKEAGYHTTVDTSGYSSVENFKSVLPYTDLFLIDIKHLDDSRHIEATGISNATILENYLFLLKNAVAVSLRIPVIPGFNDDQAHMERLRQFIISNRTDTLKSIHLLPFHRIGSSKYKRFNLPYRMEGVETPSGEHLKELKSYFEISGITVKIGG
jgi:pyruvate formate lyase activating enzyme